MYLRCSSFFLIVVTLLVSVSGLTCLPAGAQSTTYGTNLKLSALPDPNTTKTGHWTKKKIATLVFTGCVIATAIAVPIAVSCYHRRAVHRQRARDNNERTVAQLVLCKQQVYLSNKQIEITNLLRQGPLLGSSQQALLQADLSKMQQTQATLKVLYNDILLHAPLPSIIAADNALAGTLGATPSNTPYPTNIYTLEYDGFADFPRYPIIFKGLSKANALQGSYFLH